MGIQDIKLSWILEVKRESPIIAPLHKNQRVDRAKVNKVASVYAKEGPDPAGKWEQAGLLPWEK